MAAQAEPREIPGSSVNPEIPNGSAAAALVASGLGIAVIGLMTTAAVISERLKDALNWYDPVGPLSGKTGVGILAWVIAWDVLYLIWRKREVNLPRIVAWTFALIALGLLLTFPPIFEAFE